MVNKAQHLPVSIRCPSLPSFISCFSPFLSPCFNHMASLLFRECLKCVPISGNLPMLFLLNRKLIPKTDMLTLWVRPALATLHKITIFHFQPTVSILPTWFYFSLWHYVAPHIFAYFFNCLTPSLECQHLLWKYFICFVPGFALKQRWHRIRCSVSINWMNEQLESETYSCRGKDGYNLHGNGIYYFSM